MTPIKVVAIDVDTHRLSRLTHHPTNVVSFAIGPAGTIIYSAQARHSMAQSRDLLRRGFVVTNVDAFSLLSGDVDGYGFRERFESVETFVLARAGAARKRIEVNAKGSNRFIPLVEPQFSDGGRYVLLDGTPDEIPPSWNSYTEEFMHLAVEESRRHRDGPAAQQIKQLFVVDLQRLTSHPLWS